MSQLTTQQNTFSLTPQSIDEAMRMAEIMAKSEMVPKDYKNQPGNVLVAVQMGLELGLKPVQSLQNIAVINGRPAIWGDGMRALIMSASDLAGINESLDETTMTATCIISRNINGNVTSFTGSFSKTEAENAKLWGQNTWAKYPKRMLQWRAFGFAARDAYADRLKGIQLAEEVMDIPTNNAPKNIGSSEAALPEYPENNFNKSFPLWEKAIKAGEKTIDAVIATVSSKYTLTEEQQKKIKEIA